MGCTVPNVAAFALLALSLFIILLSFEPKKAGGFIKLRIADEYKTYSSGNDQIAGLQESELLVHPTYISRSACWGGEECMEEECKGMTWGGLFKPGDGKCVVTMIDATQGSVTQQREYANSLFNFGIPTNYETCDPNDSPNGLTSNCDTGDELAQNITQRGGLIRSYHYIPCTDMNGDLTKPGQNGQNCVDANGRPSHAMRDTLTNYAATKDVVFKLAQSSGTFLCLGIVCHALALLFGGFIWKLSKHCNYGCCGVFFNSMVWGSLATLLYIMSMASFVAIFFQGVKVDADHKVVYDGRASITTGGAYNWGWDEHGKGEHDKPFGVRTYSPGGAMLIAGIVFNFLAIALASWQWYKDSKEEEKEAVQEAVGIAPNNPGI